MYYTSLFVDYLKNYFKTRLTYRSDFLIEVLSDLLFQGMNLFFILVVFLHTSQLGGWNEFEIIFIYGYFMIPYGVFGCFFNLWNFTDRYIIKGEMDRVLTRPAYNLTQLVLENLDPASLFGSLGGIIILAYAWVHTGIPFHWYDPLLMLLFIFGSVLIYGGVYIALSSISFYSDAKTGILPLMWNIQNYGRYPVTIYNKIIRLMLTFVLPFAFVGFYPAAYFLDPKHWSVWALMTPIVGVVFFWIGILMWNSGVKRYRGAGS